jgi:hypothetical protein
MARNYSKENPSKRRGGIPLVAAIVIAVLGVLGMLIVDHGPWNKPKVQTAAMANYTTTGDAARAAGATVMPTEAKPQLEPVAPGPKPVQPANPATP